MKKTFLALVSLLFIFTSCSVLNKGNVFYCPASTETKAVTSQQSDEIEEYLEEMNFSQFENNSNFAFSPLSDFMTIQAGKAVNNEDNLLIHKAYAQIFNVETEKFTSSLQSLYCSEKEISEETAAALGEAYISSYSGTSREINKFVSEFVGYDVDFSDSDSVYTNKFSYSDSFYTPLSKTREVTFKGNTASVSKTFYEKETKGTYSESDQYIIAEFTINQTDMTFLLPKDSYTLKDIDIKEIFNGSASEASLTMVMPEWKVESTRSYTNMDGYFSVQGCEFSFSRKGVEGKAQTVSGGTSAQPEERKEVILDKPFYYMSSYQNVPYFIGAVTDL